MPDPIRTNLMLPTTLFDDDHVAESKGDPPLVDLSSREAAQSGLGCEEVAQVQLPCDPQARLVAAKFRRSQHGCDALCRRGEPPAREWSAAPLVNYLRGVVHQIEHNLQHHCVPTAEKLDAFVSRLLAITQRHARRAPKKRRQALQALLSRKSFARHGSSRATTPEELKAALNYLIEDLLRDFPVDVAQVEVGP